jgi:S-ribosylhomocysteine lyase
MEKIASFTINHLKLLPGVYVSRKDAVGSETLTTFDLRMTAPNREPVMNTAEMHAIEHLAATYLRNNKEWQDKIIYFGPMGCRTGFYLILAGDLTSKDILPLIISTFEFIRDFKGDVPGASAKDCGNYLDMNLPMANSMDRERLFSAKRLWDEVMLIYHRRAKLTIANRTKMFFHINIISTFGAI